MRALVPLIALTAVAGCGVHRCKAGTLLVSVELVGAAASADVLQVDVTSGADLVAAGKLDLDGAVGDARLVVEPRARR
jgi:hypothetical protein